MGSGTGGGATCCNSSKLMRGDARVSPPHAASGVSKGISVVRVDGCGAAPKTSVWGVKGSGAGGVAGGRGGAKGVEGDPNPGAGSGVNAAVAGGVGAETPALLAAISSSTFWMRPCDSNGFVTTASQPALSARSGSNGSNVPVNRTTGRLRYSGCDFTYSQTS